MLQEAKKSATKLPSRFPHFVVEATEENLQMPVFVWARLRVPPFLNCKQHTQSHRKLPTVSARRCGIDRLASNSRVKVGSLAVKRSKPGPAAAHCPGWLVAYFSDDASFSPTRTRKFYGTGPTHKRFAQQKYLWVDWFTSSEGKWLMRHGRVQRCSHGAGQKRPRAATLRFC